VQARAEGGVAAVVRPVGVDHLYLGDRGDAALAGEVLLAELDVGEVHGQAALVDEGLELRLRKLEEAVEDLDRFGLGDVGLEGLLGLERGLARLDRVDDVVLHGVHVGGRKLALEHVDLGGAHSGALALADELDALARGVGALVELAGEELDREDRGAVGDGGHLRGGVVRLRLREYRGHAGREELLVDALDVVAVDDAQVGDAVDAEERAQLALERLGLAVESGLLLYVNARNHKGEPP